VSLRGGTAAAVFPSLAMSMYFAGMPWYACVLLGLCALGTHVVRQYWLFRLGLKAIEKSSSAQVPALVAALVGEPGGRRGGKVGMR
jgi:hypothetical protein